MAKKYFCSRGKLYSREQRSGMGIFCEPLKIQNALWKWGVGVGGCGIPMEFPIAGWSKVKMF